MNQITHWLDASNIYGSSDKTALQLRQLRGGQLKVTEGPRGSRTSGALPSCSNAERSGNGVGGLAMCKNCKSCFFAGENLPKTFHDEMTNMLNHGFR